MTVLTRVLSALTTPLLPDDYLSLFNPLWSTSETRGRVVGVRRETADTATLTIRPGIGLREHRPGQWMRVGVDIDGIRHWRSYSLSGAPGTLQITVKAQGLVSEHLVHRTRPGTIVALGEPEGDFVLPPEQGKPLFVTAGSGITPVMSMLRAGVRDAVLVHSAPSRPSVIFGPELRRMDGLRFIERHTRKEGRLEPSMLEKLVPDLDERQIYACGPEEMLRALEEHFPSVRTERFRLVSTAVGEGGEVAFTRSGVTAETSGPILDAGEAAGALLPSGCRMGICFSCVGKLTSGKVRDLRNGQVHGDPGDLVQTCVSAPAGPCEIDL
ncbi:ferredoxin reductase [Actinocorallia populi]|uniref:ferredoxin reductase n=1 Tax=Actinocorallia populi TaxID=2079200 RepID=UPI000D094ADC|nr:ferredoxin reductase [Actinocorallia populi]